MCIVFPGRSANGLGGEPMGTLTSYVCESLFCLPKFEYFSSSSSSSSSLSLLPPFTNKLAHYGFTGNLSTCGSKDLKARLLCFRGAGCQPQSMLSEPIGEYEDIAKQQQQTSTSRFSNIDQPKGMSTLIKEALPQPNGNSAIVAACFVGVLTGVSVVLFNNAVHEVRDFFWDGIPYRGASWLRDEPIEFIWKRVILVPACGGLIVSLLNVLRGALEGPIEGMLIYKMKAALQPFLKAVGACFTLGTGNSLGPEGPSVEIGASIAKGVGTLLDKGVEERLSLVAAGSAAGISAGFNAAVAGCFFAVESVLWPSQGESSISLTNTTSMVILSAVIASVLSEIGLGSEPAFKVPDYDFRSPSELPLYLLLGFLCGLVSLTLSWCTSYLLAIVDNADKSSSMPRALFPVLGGLTIGLMALLYPEILYWGFENVDILLESRPFVKGPSTSLLLQLVVVKIVASSVCRASGLVGGYYAPSLFIGAATGMAYGKFINFAISQSDPNFHLSILEVASPQAYGLVGMAATLAGVCQVPLTAVLLLFELTQDYRIVLPLLGAVGLSSWVTSGQTKRRDVSNSNKFKMVSNAGDLCEVENSLCVDNSNTETIELEKRIFVSQAMRIRYVTILMSTLLIEALNLMLAEKQSCAVIVDDDNLVIGLLTLGDIQEFTKSEKVGSRKTKGIAVSEVCSFSSKRCQASWTATPSMDLLSARMIMTKHGISQLPVVSEHVEDHGGHLVGLLDTECIALACRAMATKECLSSLPTVDCTTTE
ncbi:chloride channel protein CLC-e isoform X2 [Malania oleifera]|uniref:chloride channel protein CLC-e isoform X2 n=1 Tax=Malania oleifera TaxID=397392 RepID=UPI0025AE5FA3|nr:chloride channel protein CLC-e isoform X2 [Malania oleifera]